MKPGCETWLYASVNAAKDLDSLEIRANKEMYEKANPLQ